MNRTARFLTVCVMTPCVMILVAGTAAAANRSFCAAVDDGTGTAELPPDGCGYVSPMEVFMIIDGLPPGTTGELDPFLHSFFCQTTPCGLPGGGLGGERELFDASMRWEITGTGALAGWTRTITVPITSETHSAPRTPGDAVQSFDTELFAMQGQIFGDPDFDQLQLVAGAAFGLPSPGHTTLTRRHGGSFSVDSFFDITYRIDFVGAPGSILEGLAGSTVGTVRIAVAPPPETNSLCFVPDDGSTTAELPPAGCEYRSPDERMEITGGMPPGTTVVLRPINHDFVCTNTPCGQPGGSLGGEQEVFDSTFSFRMVGTGALASFNRRFDLAATNETHSAPRTPGDPVQFFNTDTYELDVDLTGDPDFASLQITGGTSFGRLSPGQTILTQQGDGTFHVDSFFDITYQIDFVGAPGGHLDGLSGSTPGTISMVAATPPVFEDGFESGNTSAWDFTVP